MGWRSTPVRSTGSVWSRSTLSLASTAGRMAGQRMVSQLHRAHTTAASVPARSCAVTSSRPTTRPACTLASRSPAPTPRSCPHSGSTRLAHALVSTKVTFAPKPIPGDWNGAGLHTNVSTAATRKEGGIKAIEVAMEKLSKRHKEHMTVYGEDNQLRMTGKHETASYDKFSWGVANRGASVRVNRAVAEEGMGYFEDRRPASNADPYQITGIIVETCSGFADGVDIANKVKKTEAVETDTVITTSKP